MARKACQKFLLGRELIELGNLDIVSLGAKALKGVTRTWETGNTSGQRATPDMVNR
jgi:hypothetical protein